MSVQTKSAVEKVKGALSGIYDEITAIGAERNALAADRDNLIERSVGAMAIADGDEGHEKIPRDCPMLVAVSELRRTAESLANDFVSTMSRMRTLEAAANEVLRTYMRQFSDSRMVDDCLVGLAAAVSGVKTEAPKADYTAQCKGCYYRSVGPLGYGLYCYMFADRPTGPCAKRRLEPIL